MGPEVSTVTKLILGHLLQAVMLLPASAYARETGGGIPLTFFGLHIHRADQGTAWPSVPFGSWRLWDAYVTWADIQPTPTRWEFSRLDRYVDLATRHSVDILLPLANTPRWAASRPNEDSAYKQGNASEPRNIEDWRRYVTTIGERYKGRIHNYEIWNEPNIRHHYSGSIDRLVELTCEASRILKAIDSRNVIVSPGSTAGASDHINYLNRFLAKGGKNCIDVVGHHFYVPNSSPEAMVPLIRKVRAVMASHGISQFPLWNTETGWWIANNDGSTEDETYAKKGWIRLDRNTDAQQYLEKAFLISRAEGIQRFYWYSWDNRLLGLVEPGSGTPKPPARLWGNLAGELVGATNVTCSYDLGGSQCTFVKANGKLVRTTWPTTTAR